MELVIAKALRELPENVQKSLISANVFYSKEYEHYIRELGSEPIYIYSDQYIQVAAIHRMKLFFFTAALPTEPHCLVSIQVEVGIKNFLDKVMTLLKKQLKVDWVLTTPASALFSDYPTYSERIPFGNYIIDLNADEADLMANMGSKHRNMVRRGERGNVEIKYGGTELLEDYVCLDKQTWERNGQSIDNTAFYKKYIDCLRPNVTIGIAYKDSVPQCGLIGLYNDQMFYYMFGASAHRPEPGATHYLQWKTIVKMKCAGVKKYNFVGCRINEDKNSKYHNIQHFKKGFGGELQECFVFRAIFSKPKYWLFSQLLRLRIKRKPQDVIDQEIHKWASIN